ncbi:MAG TPA: hypothetical protein VLL05_00990, partial [Terriglobales bacterium]|nr:hypothetical protein [Terriglobales bacterium]
MPTTRSSYVEVGGPIHDIAYDPTHKLVFAANPQLNEVEVVSTNTLQRLPPFPISQPYTLDVTPDGKRLWVGNSGEFLDAVDLTTMHLVQHITPPRTGTSPLTNIRALVTTSNGFLLLRVGILGLSGSEGLLQYDPATRAFVDRTKDAPVPMRFVRNASGSRVLLGGCPVISQLACDGQ